MLPSTRVLFLLVFTFSCSLFVSCGSDNHEVGKEDTIRLSRYSGGGFNINTEALSVNIDADMRVTPHLQTQAGTETIVIDDRNGEKQQPRQFIKINGKPVSSFYGNAGNFMALEMIETIHGNGKRFRMWADAETGDGGKIRKTVTVDFYDDYPQIVLSQTQYTNVGKIPLNIDTYYEASLRLDASNL